MSSLFKSNLLTGHASAVLCCEVSGAGEVLASASEDGSARLWDLRTLECCQSFTSFGDIEVTSVTFSRTQEHQMFAAAGTVVKCFDFRAGAESEALAR
jgi:WD40 repeat protein